MNTFLKQSKSEDLQKVAAFTGEGAYHGSSKARNLAIPENEVAEVVPHTILEHLKNKTSPFTEFEAKFSNLAEIKQCLTIPLQEEVKNDDVTFVWCPLEIALQEAGPVTKNVLQYMEHYLEKKKKFVYIDSKIQYFKTGDLPVDSKLWHVDGTIAVRDQRATDLGYPLLHDMKARMLGLSPSPTYMAYQSSYHCATQFAVEPVAIKLPECITSFDILDQRVQEAGAVCKSQPAASIIKFDGLSLHRAVPATADGWRLWIRCVETDREVNLNSSIISCYGTVFRKT
jgi:hypothetical protein